MNTRNMPAPPPEPETGTIVTLQGATKRYGRVTAVNEISFSLRRGEIIALLGPNGAGKTTTVRLMLGLTKPTAGTVRLFGRDPGNYEARYRIGAMMQVGYGGIHPQLTIGEEIERFRSYYPNPLPFEQIIATAGLDGLARRRFGKLSGGQRQRALFALSLCGNPDLLILDEPTVGLDIDARRALWSQVRAMSAARKTILLTTHNLDEADQLADRILILREGRLVAEGTPAQLKSIETTRQLTCRTELSVGRLEALTSVAKVRVDGEKTIVWARDADAVAREILTLDPTARDLQIGVGALEDAFIALTGSNSNRNSPSEARGL